MTLPGYLPDFWPNPDKSRLVTVQGTHWHLVEFPASHPEPNNQGALVPVILMLHGTASSAHSWHGLAPMLASHHKVVCVDLPGHHLTHVSDRGALTLEGMTRELEALVKNQGWHVTAIIGHSAGAAVALNLARRLEQSPPAVVSIAGALNPFGGLLAPFFRAAAQALSKTPGLAHFVALRANKIEAVHRLVRQTGSELDEQGYKCVQYLMKKPAHIASVLSMMGGWNLSELQALGPELSHRFLSIEMANDTAVPAGQSAQLVLGNPKAETITLQGLGHLGHEEDPERVAAEIRRFLAEQRKPSF